MAFILSSRRLLTITVEDNNRKRSAITFNLDATVPAIADLVTSANDIRTAFLPLTNGRIVGASLGVPLTENDPGAVPVAESEVERKLLVPFRGLDPVVRYTAEIPSCVFSIEQTGTDNVSDANPLVAAFVAAVLANGRTNRGETLTLLADLPYVDHRNRRRAN